MKAWEDDFAKKTRRAPTDSDLDDEYINLRAEYYRHKEKEKEALAPAAHQGFIETPTNRQRAGQTPLSASPISPL